VGVQVSELLVSGTILLKSNNRTLRFVRLENKENVIGLKKFSERERYSRDVKLDSWEWVMSPRNLLKERSNTRSDVKFRKHAGNIPSKLFSLRLSSWRFLSSHQPVK
jgi:hypothetical protein